jgi:hypothetical protein
MAMAPNIPDKMQIRLTSSVEPAIPNQRLKYRDFLA